METSITLNATGGVLYYGQVVLIIITSFVPDSSQIFTVNGTDLNGCENIRFCS